MMEWIGIIDLVSLILVLVAMVFVLKGWRSTFSPGMNSLFAGVLVFRAFHNLSNSLEWLGIYDGLVTFEDFVEIIGATLLIFFLYAFIKVMEILERTKREEAFRAAHELFDSYIFSVADGLRNPLQVFLGNMETMESAHLDEKHQKALQDAKEAARLLESNIVQLTDREIVKKVEASLTEGKDVYQLLKDEEKHRNVFNSSKDAIFVVDPGAGTIVDANKAALELIGIPLEDIKGRKWMVPPEEPSEHISHSKG